MARSRWSFRTVFQNWRYRLYRRRLLLPRAHLKAVAENYSMARFWTQTTSIRSVKQSQHVHDQNCNLDQCIIQEFKIHLSLLLVWLKDYFSQHKMYFHCSTETWPLRNQKKHAYTQFATTSNFVPRLSTRNFSMVRRRILIPARELLNARFFSHASPLQRWMKTERVRVDSGLRGILGEQQATHDENKTPHLKISKDPDYFLSLYPPDNATP